MRPSRVSSNGTKMRVLCRARDGGLGQAKVEHLHCTVRCELDVGRLQIAVRDALVVHRLQSRRHLNGDADRILDWETTGREALGQRWTADELHHEERRLVDLIEVVDAGDVRM
jgi:hypothetical protein